MMGVVWYLFRDRHDIPLAITTLVAFSAVYSIIRLYFSLKRRWLLVIILPVIIGFVVYILVRPQGIALSINGQAVTGPNVSLTEGSVLVNPAPSVDGKYDKGTIVTLSASAISGYDWKSWTATDSDTSNPTTVNMSSKKYVTVTFEPSFSLVINNETVIGAVVRFTEGSVSVNPAPGDDGKYDKGTVVTLTASASSGYDWKYWTATASDTSNPTTLNMSSGKHITVTFEPRFSLNISNQLVIGSTVSFTEGSVSLNPAPGDDGKYARGTAITLTASPASGYGFKNWAGTSSDTSNPTIVNISSDKHVLVTFELRFPLTINNQVVTGPSANYTEGSVSVNPAPKDDGKYAKDTTVVLTASPASGYRFDRWAGDASGNVTTTNITINSSKSVTAVFIKFYNLSTSVSPTEGGSISPGGGTYDDGTTITLTASPASGYRFDRWEGDASGNTTTASITINSDKNVTAVFIKVYTLSIAVSPTGGGSISHSSGTYDDGTTITLTAIPATGYRFDHWEGDASGNVATANITINSNKNVTAVFVQSTP